MRHIFCVAAFLLVCCVAHHAQAAIELKSFNVTSNTSDPGLIVNTSPSMGGLNDKLVIAGGPGVTVDLFKIWTNETSVNAGEDTVSKPISINFTFSSNGQDFAANVMGVTQGIAGFFLFVPIGAGAVDWDSPAEILFGNGGKLRIELLDQLFNANFGYGNLAAGESNGANVKARFTLISDSVPPPAVEPGDLHAPEPAAVAVWAGLGIASAVGGYRCRRFAA